MILVRAGRKLYHSVHQQLHPVHLHSNHAGCKKPLGALRQCGAALPYKFQESVSSGCFQLNITQSNATVFAAAYLARHQS